MMPDAKAADAYLGKRMRMTGPVSCLSDLIGVGSACCPLVQARERFVSYGCTHRRSIWPVALDALHTKQSRNIYAVYSGKRFLWANHFGLRGDQEAAELCLFGTQVRPDVLPGYSTVGCCDAWIASDVAALISRLDLSPE